MATNKKYCLYYVMLNAMLSFLPNPGVSKKLSQESMEPTQSSAVSSEPTPPVLTVVESRVPALALQKSVDLILIRVHFLYKANYKSSPIQVLF